MCTAKTHLYEHFLVVIVCMFYLFIQSKTESSLPEEERTNMTLNISQNISKAAKPDIPQTSKEKPSDISWSITERAAEDKDNCTKLTGNFDHLTQDQFITKLAASCRYDKLTKPITDDNSPLQVSVQIDLTHIEAIEQLKFQTHMLVQYSYKDTRLRYDDISPRRIIIVGQELLRNKIWVPHVIIRNERATSIMGSDGRDIFVSIGPTGDVVYSYRMTATFYCWMNLQKFPFDSQLCNIVWSSWAYNTTNLRLLWERERPVRIAPQLHLTEFIVSETWTEEKDEPAPFKNGGLVGNYSTLLFKFKLTRQIGFYLLDYFLPSVLLVITSWVTFWLQADATPPRATLGTSTMLAFITLSGNLTRNLPKVSYIKASEIWFLGCAFFIFCSLAEFAFVNVIWRRKKKVELRKQTSKHILRSALTPSLARKQLKKAESLNSLYKARSCSSLEEKPGESPSLQNNYNNYLTVHSFPTLVNTAPIRSQTSQDQLMRSDDSITTVPVPEQSRPSVVTTTWHTMTPQEVAIWIDKKSRIVFPVAFLIFNILYWSFVYAV